MVKNGRVGIKDGSHHYTDGVLNSWRNRSFEGSVEIKTNGYSDLLIKTGAPKVLRMIYGVLKAQGKRITQSNLEALIESGEVDEWVLVLQDMDIQYRARMKQYGVRMNVIGGLNLPVETVNKLKTRKTKIKGI